MAQHDRASRAEKGWRLPRDLRTSGMSEKTSMSGRGCGIMSVGFHERVWGHGGVPGKRDPTWNKTLELVFGLIGKLFPKTEWPCPIRNNLVRFFDLCYTHNVNLHCCGWLIERAVGEW